MSLLLKSILPEAGQYCLATVKTGIRQQFYGDIDDLIADASDASAAGGNAYYAMASYTTNKSREQTNVALIKSFWLDVDCKNKENGNDYADKQTGLEAIRSFCTNYGFPRPTIVDSGNGWHCYWILEHSVTREVWQPVANKLKHLCLASGFKIDPACTADAARILRIPDTKNYRFNPPSDVKLVSLSSPVSLQVLEGIIDLGVAQVGVPATQLNLATPSPKQMSAVTKALLGNNTSSFRQILMRCMNGTGCAQIEHAAANQAVVEEPLWRAVLSVAQHCSDGAKGIHVVSNQHPEYDFHTTVKKAAETKGPYTCDTFDALRAGVCGTCPHRGKLTSPIQLGHQIIASQTPTVVEQPVAPNPTPSMVSEQDVGSLTIMTADEITKQLEAFEKQQAVMTIPVPPKPYLRGQNGGIYKRTKLDDGTFDDVLIYENDFYVHSRLFDPVDGQVLACRLHLPMDGIRHFNIPLKSVGSKDELRKIVCSQGVAATDKTIAELSYYLITLTREIQQMSHEEKARMQMGWQADNSFVLGDREYTKTGIRHCPPSSATKNYQEMFSMQGDLATWRKVLDVYNQPGFEIHQFVFFFMSSSVLMQWINQPGMLCSLISDASGIGKSTLGRVCNSVWGDPDEMQSMPHDTINAVANRMGVFNSVGTYTDELTNKDAETISNIIYMTDHGRAKNRMTASANIERDNMTTWRQNHLTTANASLRDKVSSIKASSEGENMRLFEFDMRETPVLDKSIADSTFPLLAKHYGVAGHIIVCWLVQNCEQIERLVVTTQRTMDKKFGFTSKERKWSAAVAGAYTMAAIMQKLGLHDFDVQANVNFMVNKINDMRREIRTTIASHNSILGDFLMENHSAILIINGLPDLNGLKSPPVNRNINRIVARYEPDTGKLYVSTKDLQRYCTARQFSYSSLKELTGAISGTNCRIAAGSGVVAGSIPVLVFDPKTAGLDTSMFDVVPDANDDNAA